MLFYLLSMVAAAAGKFVVFKVFR